MTCSAHVGVGGQAAVWGPDLVGQLHPSFLPFLTHRPSAEIETRVQPYIRESDLNVSWVRCVLTCFV
jgi:hypothetical protein